MTEKAERTETTPAETKETAPSPLSPFVDPFGFANLLHWPDRWTRNWGELMRDENRINVEEFVEGDDLHIRAELPGVDPEKDIDITVDRGRITIKAEREQRTESDEDGYRSEFRYGSFSRILPLPEGADAEDVSATYEDGILDVRVPVAPEREPARKVTVSSS